MKCKTVHHIARNVHRIPTAAVHAPNASRVGTYITVYVVLLTVLNVQSSQTILRRVPCASRGGRYTTTHVVHQIAPIVSATRTELRHARGVTSAGTGATVRPGVTLVSRAVSVVTDTLMVARCVLHVLMGGRFIPEAAVIPIAANAYRVQMEAPRVRYVTLGGRYRAGYVAALTLPGVVCSVVLRTVPSARQVGMLPMACVVTNTVVSVPIRTDTQRVHDVHQDGRPIYRTICVSNVETTVLL
jgi:hypothetical protein